VIYSYGRDRLQQLLQAWLVRGPEEALPPGQTVITRRLPQPEFQSLRIRRAVAVPAQALPPGQARIVQPGFAQEIVYEQSIVEFRQPEAAAAEGLPEGQSAVVQPVQVVHVIQPLLESAAVLQALPEGRSAFVRPDKLREYHPAFLVGARPEEAAPEALPEGHAVTTRVQQEPTAVRPILASIDPTTPPEALPEGRSVILQAERLQGIYPAKSFLVFYDQGLQPLPAGQRAFVQFKIVPGLSPSFLFGLVQEIPPAQDLPEGKQIVVHPRFPVHVQSLRIRRPSAVPPAALPPGHQITTRREAIPSINQSFVGPLPFIPDAPAVQELPPGKSITTRQEILTVVNRSFIHPLSFIPDAPPEGLPPGKSVTSRQEIPSVVNPTFVHPLSFIPDAAAELPPGKSISTRSEIPPVTNPTLIHPLPFIPDALLPEDLPAGRPIFTRSNFVPQVRQLRIFTIYPATRPLPPGTFVTTRLEPIETINQSFVIPAILIPDAEDLPPGKSVSTRREVPSVVNPTFVHPYAPAEDLPPGWSIFTRFDFIREVRYQSFENRLAVEESLPALNIVERDALFAQVVDRDSLFNSTTKKDALFAKTRTTDAEF